MKRQIVLDTETTGLEPEAGHRIIEIGAVELVDRRLTGKVFHTYLDPQREIDDAAEAVHGISRDFLADKPKFADVAEPLLAFLGGAELVIHNAAFDMAFLEHELAALGTGRPLLASSVAGIVDSLLLARLKHPGQKNSLDALCRRYGVDDAHRTLHGALLDAQLLAEVYLALTGGQTSLLLAGDTEQGGTSSAGADIRRIASARPRLLVVAPNIDELRAHAVLVAKLERSGTRLWPPLFAYADQVVSD